MIGYYIHHHGRGHLTRAETIARELREPVVALSSLPITDVGVFESIVRLPRDDDGSPGLDPTAHERLHWAPRHHVGLRTRMGVLADWVCTAAPRAVVVDVSVEVTAFVRLMGVPTVVVAMPGVRRDAAHRLAYDVADHIIAAWPRALYEPDWLSPHTAKTSFVGGVSRFDGRSGSGRPCRRPRVTVLSGAGGTSLAAASVEQWRSAVTGVEWVTLGGPGSAWKDDPWPDLCASTLVISHAGQNAVADVATAGVPAVIVPQQRPFHEQDMTARVLESNALAVVRPVWPSADEWPLLLDEATENSGRRWPRWETAGAAARAARAIEAVAADQVSA